MLLYSHYVYRLVSLFLSLLFFFSFFFFKQKTAYEMRISDWSSDVCSSDLVERVLERCRAAGHRHHARAEQLHPVDVDLLALDVGGAHVDQIGRASCRERVCQYV